MQAADDIFAVTFDGDQHDDSIGHFTQAATCIEAIHPGHNDVQQDGVGMGLISQL